jgi:signal transduction histidine kinase
MLNPDNDLDIQPTPSINTKLSPSDRLENTDLSADLDAPQSHRMPTQRLYQQSSTVSIFQAATAQAISLLDAPVAIVSTIAGSRLQISAISGIAKFARLAETDDLPDKLAGLEYCHDRAIASDRAFVITNCQAHPHLSNSSLCQVRGMQAYLGVPMITAAGDKLGAISILDFRPRQFSDREIDLLQLISRLAASEFERAYLSQAQLDRLMEDFRSREVRIFDDGVAASEHSRTVTTRESYATETFPRSPIAARTHLPNGIRSMPTIGNLATAKPQIKGEIQFKLLTHLAQEMRTPLTSAIGMARVLQQEIYGVLSVKQKKYLGIIHDSGLQLVKIVDEIAELSTFDRYQSQLTLKSVDLDLLCQLVLQSLEPLAQQKQQRIALDLTSRNAIVEPIQDRFWVLDREKVRQIVYYLSLSLIQASANHQQITIQLAKLPDRLQLQITTSDDHVILGAFPPDDDSQPLVTTNSNMLPLTAIVAIDRALPTPSTSNPTAPSLQTEIGQDLRISLGLSLSQTLAALHGGTIQLTADGCGYQLSLPLMQPEQKL